jgi:hypothetical protein
VTHSRTRRRRFELALGTAALIALIAGVAWRLTAGKPKSNGSPAFAVASCPYPTTSGWNVLTLSGNAAAQVGTTDGQLVFTVHAARWRQLDPGRWQVVLETGMANRSASDVRHDSFQYRAIIMGQREFDQNCFDAPREIIIPGTIGDARTGYIVTCMPMGRIDLSLADSAATRLQVTDAPETSSC